MAYYDIPFVEASGAKAEERPLDTHFLEYPPEAIETLHNISEWDRKSPGVVGAAAPPPTTVVEVFPPSLVCSTAAAHPFLALVIADVARAAFGDLALISGW